MNPQGVQKNPPDNREASGRISFATPYPEMLKELYKLNPDNCLRRIAAKIKDIFNCETVCILLWNEGQQQLITEYECGLPPQLERPETYAAHEGLTGKIIFSQNRSVRCVIDIQARKIFDSQSQQYIAEKTIKWDNMAAYRHFSCYGDFKSLLGAPFSVRSQKLGAVKLINKLDAEGRLAEAGFDADDLQRLSYFLEAIEHVVGMKRNEKQVQSLLKIGEKLLNTTSDYGEILTAIAANCAEALNYRVCLIRLFEENRLLIKASNLPLQERDALESRNTPASYALKHRLPIRSSPLKPSRTAKKSRMQGRGEDGDTGQLQMESARGDRKMEFSKLNSRFSRFLHHHGLKSFLVVPIIQQGNAIGTLECYTSLAHEFSSQELDVAQLYIDVVLVTTINNKQQQLLESLIDLQKLGEVADEGGGEEEKVVSGVLRRTRSLLGGKLKVLGVLFSEEQLKRAYLKLESLHQDSSKKLKTALGRKMLEKLLGDLKSRSRPGGTQVFAPPAVSQPQNERESLTLITADIAPESDDAPWGILVVGLQPAHASDTLPMQVAKLSAHQLGVMLGNITKHRRLKKLLEIIDEVSRQETLPQSYQAILQATTGFFGFDFGTISRIDYMNRMVETVLAHSAKFDLVDPNQWLPLSRYEWNKRDILTDVLNTKSAVIINAATAGEPRDERLNEEIYTRFQHQNLARIWVPFIFRRTANDSKPNDRQQDDTVLAIIEAGYHRQTQPTINKEKSELFIRFIESCAKSLQWGELLEERKSVDDILKKFNEERSPGWDAKDILRKLLQTSVDLVGGDWGDVTFLTHADDKIKFIDHTISYRLPPQGSGRLMYELEVGETGNTGIVGYVAATEKHYWSNDVKNDPKYIEEFEEVKSELAVPLRFYGQTFGVLNINSNKRDWFDERKATLVQTVTDQGAILYQNARLVAPLYKLISPFNPFASPPEIYAKVIHIIEDFLDTKTVSVWAKVADDHTFTLQLAGASSSLAQKYKEKNITTLPLNTFTAEAVAKKSCVYVSEEEIQEKFIYAEFARQNELRSMTSVPMLAGDDIYGVINVFSRRNTKLFDEEMTILQILANKAAIALQSALLIESFSDTASIALNDDIHTILNRIARKALEILHADPIILFRYDASAKQFAPDAIRAGNLYDESVQIEPNENDMANLIVTQNKPIYLKNEADYLDFEREVNRRWHSERFDQDFWHRENIQSLAALKLEHRGETVGVMFINYRKPKDFTDYVERLIKVFASQAASAIYNAKISEQNKQFLEIRRADSLSLSVSEIVSSLAHNAGHLLNRINHRFGKIDNLLSRGKFGEAQWSQIKEEVEKMKDPLDELSADFERLDDYRKLDEMRLEYHEINALVKESLDMIRDMFHNQRVSVDERYAANLPQVNCDENQIKHVLLNLFLNATEAMGHKGKLSVATSLNRQKQEIEIRVSDTGPGIPREHRDKIFEMYFTTKKQKAGSGSGLPISRYIIKEHGGHIELGPSSSKGASFFVYLPLSD